MCCGSGAIGISILRHRPHTRVTFADIREDHLATVQKNLQANTIEPSRAICVISDMFESIRGTYDHIVANPPYIPEKRALPESVLKYEPHDALFSGEDGFRHLYILIAHAKKHVQQGGSLYAEIDSSESTCALEEAQRSGATKASVLPDQYGVPRVLVAHY
jgi:release factor glutamine methyltransferase